MLRPAGIAPSLRAGPGRAGRLLEPDPDDRITPEIEGEAAMFQANWLVRLVAREALWKG
ncbi:hypothetical protein ABIA38_006720 [Embleya sp. AB8]